MNGVPWYPTIRCSRRRGGGRHRRYGRIGCGRLIRGTAAAFSPDGNQIASTGLNNVIAVWDGGTGAVRQTMSGHDAYVSHVLWVGPNLIVANDWAGTIMSWTRVSDGGNFASANVWQTGGQSLGIALSPDGQTLAVGGGDATTHVEGFSFIPVGRAEPLTGIPALLAAEPVHRLTAWRATQRRHSAS